MAILTPYNGDEEPEALPALEYNAESADAWQLTHRDRVIPQVDQIAAAIAEYQVDRDERLSALDHTTVSTTVRTED